MKIELDTTNKTIKVQEDVNLKELSDTIFKLLPNGEWKNFTLKTNVKINWTPNPIVFDRTYPYWRRPWYGPDIYCDNTADSSMNLKRNDTKFKLDRGVYHVDIKSEK